MKSKRWLFGLILGALVAAGGALFMSQSPVHADDPHIWQHFSETWCTNCGIECVPCRPKIGDNVHVGGPDCTLVGCAPNQCHYDCPGL